MVETAGIEPASEQEAKGTSTCIVWRFNLTVAWQPDQPYNSDSEKYKQLTSGNR